jgi:arylsulfatase A-like enzyme
MNVIWIIADTFRQDHLGCYGNDWIQTPALDSLAARSVRFDRHYAADFPTMPCRADFLTGRWTGCFMQWEPLSRDLILLPQVLSSNRILTTAIVDTPFYLRNGMGYDRGFKGFIEIRGQQYGRPLLRDVRPTWRFESDRFAPRTFSRAMEWLDGYYKEQPFFLYIDVWDPHEPWDAPAYYTERYWPNYDGELIDAAYAYWQDIPGLTEEKVKKAHAAYCGECTMVDTWLGYFLRKVENMGLLENTAIIFTTDHGFYFGEHDGLFGKMTRAFPGTVPFWNEPDLNKQAWTHSPLFEECVLCPLLIYVPGNKPGIYRGLTSAVDLMPTVLDIFSQEIPDAVEGESLLPKVQDLSIPGRSFTISTHPFAKQHKVIRSVDGEERQSLVDSDTTITTDEWSLLFNTDPGRSMLFHLPTDRKQEKNIIREQPEVARDLHQMLVKFMDDYHLVPELRDPRLKLTL